MHRTRVLVAAVAFATGLSIPVWTVDASGTGEDGHTHAAAATAQDTGPVAGSSQTGTTGEEPVDHEKMDATMAARAKSFPAKTKGVGGQVLEPTVLADGTKEFRLTAKQAKWEVEPGKIVDAFTYNGTVPGPLMRVDVGDKVRVVLKNELPESTVIHWHGMVIPNGMDGVSDITQDPVKPGATFNYDFVASEQAVGWYHSHHNGAKQVADGLFGTFIIGSVPLPAGVQVSQELPFMVQDSGAIGMALNGKSYPATAPVRAHLGEWIEIHYVNAGAQAHPMHLHGMPQLVIAKDGLALPAPYRADTVNVAPGERYTVLVHADQPGKWAWHCHIFPHSEDSRGMFGLFTELIVS